MDFAAGSALPRYKVNPCSKVTTGFEDLGVNDCGGDRRCRDHADARNGLKA
jgi:hypothetical protein